jgi:hypothetical protein
VKAADDTTSDTDAEEEMKVENGALPLRTLQVNNATGLRY